MYAEIPGFDRQALTHLIQTEWDLDTGPVEAFEPLEYVPAGFGTHHYRAGTRWFVNVDTGPPGRLERALSAAASLAEQGLEFVHAPRRTRQGFCVATLGGYAVSVFAFLDGESFGYGDFPDPGLRREVVAALARMHAATPQVLPRKEEFVVGHRDTVFSGLDRRWDAGPHGETARRLVSEGAGHIRALLDRFDELVPEIRSGESGWVVTHGEPHAANVMRTRDGIRLIDWDTAAFGPRERDLWMIGESYDGYTPDPRTIELYRLWWEAAEICDYTATLRGAHADDANTRVAVRELGTYLSSSSASHADTGSPH